MITKQDDRRHLPSVVPYKTRTGVEIGRLYTPPPPKMSLDEERIQRALLRSRPSFADIGLLEYVWTLAVAFAALGIFALLIDFAMRLTGAA